MDDASAALIKPEADEPIHPSTNYLGRTIYGQWNVKNLLETREID
jgi:hypothetical protein